MIAPVVDLYTAPECPPCKRARSLLLRRHIDFVEHSVEELAGGIGALVELAGAPTVPQVVIRGRPVGGAEELFRLDRAGVLLALVRGDRFPVAVVRRRLALGPLLRWAVAPFLTDRPGVWRYTVDLVDERARVLECSRAGSAAEAERLAASRPSAPSAAHP